METDHHPIGYGWHHQSKRSICTVSHWENGRFPPTKMAHILLGYIGTHHHIDIPLEDEIEEVEQ